MTEEELKVVISTDIGDGLKGILAFEKAADELTKITKDLSAQFGGLSKSLDDYTKSNNSASSSTAKVANSVSAAGKAIQSVKTPIDNVNKGTINAGAALTNLGRVASDLPFGFIAIQNNLDPLVQSFGSIFSQSKNAAEGFKAIGSALLGAGGIALAFSVVSSAVTTLIQKYGSLSNALQALNPFITEQEKGVLALNRAIVEGGPAVTGQIAQLSLLFTAVKDGNIPLSERKLITDQLIKQYPDTFNGLTAEAIAAGKADEAYKSLTKTILAQAAVKAGNDAISAQGKELFELRLEARKLNDELIDLQQNGNKGSLLFGKSVLDNSRDIAAIQNKINDNKAKQNKLDLQASAIQQEQLKLVEQFGAKVLDIKIGATVPQILAKLSSDLSTINTKAQLTGETAKDVARDKISVLTKAFEDVSKIGGAQAQPALKDIGSQISALRPIAESSTKSVKTVSDIMKDLNQDLVGLDAGFAGAGGSLRDLSEDKIKRLTDALKELSTVGVLPGSTLANAIKDQIKALQSTLAPTPVTLQIPVKIQPLPAASNANTIATLMKGLKQEFAPELNAFTKELNDLINKSTQNSISSLAEGIGTALATGDIGAATAGFVNAISGFLSELGKVLIVQGLAIQAFQTSLETLQGIPAIIAGGALIAASAAFKALAGKGVSSFATGGTVFGPTLAMIGDNPGREEHIVPSEVIDKLSGGGGFPDRVELFARGTTLAAVLQRGNNSQSRING